MLVPVLTMPALLSDSAAAGGRTRPPRVEDLAVKATADQGVDAPAAVVRALADGASLRRVVRQIEAGTLPIPEDPVVTSTTTTTSVPSTDVGTNPVIAISDGRIEPSRVVVDPASPLIVANRGAKVHVVEIKGTGLPKYSLEPDLVGVYELEQLAPGRYTLRCVVAGHEERVALTIPGAATGSLRNPVGAVPARLGSGVRVADGIEPETLSAVDYLERLVMFDAVVEEMAVGGATALEEAERMRERAAREQAELGAKSEEATTADPRRVVARAEKEDADPEVALLTTAILLAAKNGYDAGQITEFLLDDQLAPEVWETGQGAIRLRDVFLAGGVILGVVPKNPPVDGVFRADPPHTEPEPERPNAEPGDGGGVSGRYRGEFTGPSLESYLQGSYPGAPRPIQNRVDVTISDDGVMRFELALVVKAAWVRRDDTVLCDSRYDVLAAVTPRPTAEPNKDGTFESTPFNASGRQTDFSGPECGSHPYQGDNDQQFTGLVLVGSVKGDTLRGRIPFEEAGAQFELEFRATRR